MYVPSHFKEDRVDILHDAIRRAGAATLVSMTPQGLFASHAPLLIDPEPAPFGTLVGHLAKANPHGRLLDPNHPSFVGNNNAQYWRQLLNVVDKVVAKDARTVQVFVKHPYAPLLGNLAKFPIAGTRRLIDAALRRPAAA